MVLLRMRFVQIKMRRTKRGSADPGRETRARSTIIGVGNNVGIGVREWFFVSITYAFGALGGTRTPTILLTATSRQRVYQFRHERLGDRHRNGRTGSTARDVTNQGWRDKACRRGDSQADSKGLPAARQPR